MQYIMNYSEAQKLKKPLFIDVRSPHEFEEGSIPGAINLPIMDDETHQAVGYLYKRESIAKAKLRGMTYMSEILPVYYEQVQQLMKQHDLVFYCKSGGFRSSSIIGLLRGLGEDVYQLAGGYKAYRQFVLDGLEELPSQFKFISLDGLTGTGKTEILQILEASGAQVLDLEGLANHRGSHFGPIGLGKQPSQKDYEGALYDKLRGFEAGFVFTEGESASIGKVHTPNTLFRAYKQSPHQVYIAAPLDQRVERIAEEYLGNASSERIQELAETIQAMNKLSPKRQTAYLEALAKGDYRSIIEDLIVSYYDQHYTLANRHFELTYNNLNSQVTAQALLQFYQDKQLY